MMDRKLLLSLQKDAKEFDRQREKIINLSRQALKASKKSIYATQRKDTKEALKLLAQAKKHLSLVKKTVGSNPLLATIGAKNEAEEEYAEANLFLAFSQNKPMPSPKQLQISNDQYLAGLCDVSGEVVRAAINAAINEQYQETKRIQKFLSELYGELMKFDFRNGPIRRKFDAVKYGLEKVEDLMLDLKLKDKL